ncbi:hypothetical protein CDAR_566111 [Caerostris darwini]|uniref:Uncharacterized protein n=1 Tax=Caerostris darwini TaxID=1538125 RepID=A0AAV4VU94_9ARAC|nr:hypothetical protein CDAR_566111 [Caerostris darwini]
MHNTCAPRHSRREGKGGVRRRCTPSPTPPPFFFCSRARRLSSAAREKFTARMRVSCTSSFSLSLSLGTGWEKITRSSVQRRKRTGSGTRSNFWEVIDL